MQLSRRKFITTVAVAGAAATVTGTATSGLLNLTRSKYPIYFFTKPLDEYENSFMAETLSMVGNITGYDVTVRSGGKIEPSRVEDELPKFVEDSKKYNFDTKMMVTAFTGAEDLNIKKVLSTASSLGIKHYRMGYISYDDDVDIWEFIENLRTQFVKLAELNKLCEIQAGYQNHAGGARFGSPLWDLWEIVRDMPKEYISSQFDVRHAMVEGASTWIIALRLLKNKIGSLAIKDFNWELDNGKAKSVHVPMGEGLVDYDLFFKTVKELDMHVPITLHVEYPLLSGKEESLPLLQKQKILVSKIKKDVDYVRSYLIKYELI